MFFHVFHPTLECFLNPSNSSFHVLWLAAIQWTAAGQNTMERWLSPHAQMTPNVSQDLVRWMQSQQSAINLKFKSKKAQDRSGQVVQWVQVVLVSCSKRISVSSAGLQWASSFSNNAHARSRGASTARSPPGPSKPTPQKKIHLVLMYLLCIWDLYRYYVCIFVLYMYYTSLGI